jgi:dihydropteroate synthase
MGSVLAFPTGSLSLDRPRMMGVLNVTPDSFSDGGRFFDRDAAVAQARALVDAGADILDVGGESTRPGATEVPVADELARVVPVVEAIAGLGVPVSVDTRKAEVMRQAVAAGAGMINDVSALEHDPEALAAAAELGVPVCLMHMQGTPETMQADPTYGDVVAEVRAYLAERADRCREAGIDPEAIVLDPGIGFGKTVAHNLALLHHLETFTELGYPLLVGTSRKSLLGRVLDRGVTERVHGDAALVAWSVSHGASIVRVHDVGPMYDVVTMTRALMAGHAPAT